MFSMPPLAMTSASLSVAQQMPIAPAAIWRLAISIDFAPLPCGRRFTPAALVNLAIVAMFRSSASRSSSSAGVESCERLPFTPMKRAFGPRPAARELTMAHPSIWI